MYVQNHCGDLGHSPLVQDALRGITSNGRTGEYGFLCGRRKEEGWRAHLFQRPGRRHAPTPRSGVEDKGLKKNAIGFVSSVVIGVASTAPGYSLAATLGFVAAAVGLGAPAVLLISFVPMFLVAGGYYYMNKADPDCGTSFSWVTKAMGPQLGWIAGWVIVVADIIVMANLAQIAGLYTFELFGWTAAAESTRGGDRRRRHLDRDHDRDRRHRDRALGAHPGRPAGGRGHHPRALRGRRPGQGLHRQRRARTRSTPASPGSTRSPSAPARSRPGCCSRSSSIGDGTRRRPSTRRPRIQARRPGKATVISTLILLGIYIVVAIAAQSYDGVKGLVAEPEDVLSHLGTDVFGSPLDKILIIAVLTSAAASTQTTILPTARTTLSMARANAMPKSLGKVHPRFLTPHISTILMGDALDRLVRRPDPGLGRHPLRLARRARPDDRLLHRPHRLRLHRSTTGAS